MSSECLVASVVEEVARKTSVYHPSVWGDYFITHVAPSSQAQDNHAWMKERSRDLREQIKSILQDYSDFLQTMQLIDAIQLLGVDYHFEKEISEALSKVYNADLNTHGLYEVALRFRLLRQHGYNISPGSKYSSIFESVKL
ncbi:hypothetical protein GW17_00036398 [Ensete ventricosum]|nr:hypothetical protein GW17_00036398 [Ensete ventricosum]